jgi:hypothetical protein
MRGLVGPTLDRAIPGGLCWPGGDRRCRVGRNHKLGSLGIAVALGLLVGSVGPVKGQARGPFEKLTYTGPASVREAGTGGPIATATRPARST